MSRSDVCKLVISSADGRDDGEDWAGDFRQLPGDAGVSIIVESTSRPGVGPRLHEHPYAETFIIRRGSAAFTVGSSRVTGRAGQVLVAPAKTPHEFATGPDGYEAVHIHAGPDVTDGTAAIFHAGTAARQRHQGLIRTPAEGRRTTTLPGPCHFLDFEDELHQHRAVCRACRSTVPQ